MAIGTKERTELRTQLVSQGYQWKYIDEWQPKVILYRHRPMTSTNGEVVSPVGTALRNLPGNPDYVSKKARIGLFTWPPSATCPCSWCSVGVIVLEEPGTSVDPSDTLQPVVARKTRARGKPTR